jgi:branched-chain amino acid transport system ATP-binding protein
MTALLHVADLESGYVDLPVLHGVTLDDAAGEIVSVVGANGAGKTTLVSTIAGLIPATAGRVEFDGTDITGRPANWITPRGIALVPEGRRLFPFLTVGENLRLGAYHSDARRHYAETLDEVLEMFPALAERRDQAAGSLSGGEQQMCAIARGLMARPKLMMLDEPSLGLAPIIVEHMFELIAKLAAGGLTVLLIEQNVAEALDISGRVYVLEQGRVVMSGTPSDLLGDDRLRSAYLGVA